MEMDIAVSLDNLVGLPGLDALEDEDVMVVEDRTAPRDDLPADARIGAILVKEGLLNEEQLATVIEEHNETPDEMLGETAIRLGYLNDKQLAHSLSTQLRVPFVDLGKVSIDPEALQCVPSETAAKHGMIPLYFEDDDLVLAMVDPLNIGAIDDARFVSGYSIRPSIASKSQLEAAINWYYRLGDALDEMTKKVSYEQNVSVDEDEFAEDESLRLKRSSEMAPTIRLVNGIILQGIQAGSSDIHLEPRANELLVRNRVDGVLEDAMRAPKWAQSAVLSRIKIMSGMDITKHSIPQDGRISVKLKNKQYDLRVSVLPAKFGEKAVLRVLDSDAVKPELEQLGVALRELKFMQRLAHANQGMVLICGPTGSGKTTTLYSMINEAKDGRKNIMTIEDPIEYEIEGVNQVQVRAKDGLTFANVLRSVLRQDPDVVLVGEIRDSETASIGLQAAMTGHLVLSTLHTINAVSALPRLLDLGVAPYLVASSLNGIVAQRLVRMICSECRTECEPDAEVLERMESALGRKLELTFYRGAGCDRCGHSGYKGRVGVFEMFGITPEIQELINSGASESELMAMAKKQMSYTMFQDGLRKIDEGITTLEEIERVVPFDDEEGEASEPEATCASCGETLRGEWNVCPYCAASAKEPAPSAAPATTHQETGSPLPADPAPAAEDVAVPSTAPDIIGESRIGDHFEGSHVLVVERNPKTAKAIRDFFTEEGYRATVAPNGHVALTCLLQETPQLVITEVEMSGMDGIQLLQTLRRNEGTAAIPVIMLSVRGDLADRLKGFEAGCDDYIPKPFSKRELLARATAVLRRAYRVTV